LWKRLRDLAKRLEELRIHIPQILWAHLNVNLNLSLIGALTLTANLLNPNVAQLTEAQKDFDFLTDGKKGVGILLYEFANGKGPNSRDFSNGLFWSDFFEGDRIANIKADFETQLIVNNLSFDQFVANGAKIEGSHNFSPGHTSIINSINEHVNANWVQFFVGGTSAEYKPSNVAGYIDVILTNPTSRNSLLLHIGDNYSREDFGSTPLSTIEQHFYIRIKVR